MRLANAPIVARNLLMVVWNRAAKLTRVSSKHAKRGLKQVNESVKEARAQVKFQGLPARICCVKIRRICLTRCQDISMERTRSEPAEAR